MYSRFVTWQKNPTFSSLVKASDVNQFIVDDEAMDFRFNLKGYGFKKVGEQNRVVHHFGCYKCFYRKVGEADWNLFAHVMSARESSEGSNVYKDISVTSGSLAQAQYEVKVVACRLIELENWIGGEVEGIASDDQFFYELQARQNIPNRVKVSEAIDVQESLMVAFDIVDLVAGIEYEEVTYAIDMAYMEVPVDISILEDTILVIENLNVQTS